MKKVVTALIVVVCVMAASLAVGGKAIDPRHIIGALVVNPGRQPHKYPNQLPCNGYCGPDQVLCVTGGLTTFVITPAGRATIICRAADWVGGDLWPAGLYHFPATCFGAGQGAGVKTPGGKVNVYCHL